MLRVKQKILHGTEQIFGKTTAVYFCVVISTLFLFFFHLHPYMQRYFIGKIFPLVSLFLCPLGTEFCKDWYCNTANGHNDTVLCNSFRGKVGFIFFWRICFLLHNQKNLTIKTRPMVCTAMSTSPISHKYFLADTSFFPSMN